MNLLDQINKEVEAGEVGEYNETAAKLAQLQEEYGSEVPQCDTKQGYERSKKIASDCRAIRVALENKRKEIKAPALAFGKMIDSEAKRIKAELEAIEVPHLNAYREVDEEKKRKKAEFEQKLFDLKKLPTLCAANGLSSDQINIHIEEVSEISIDKETFGHKLGDAKGWVPSVLNQLIQLHAQAIEKEAEQARIEAERLELEKLRREQAEREEQERQDRLKAELEQREKEIAEQARIEAELKAEREKQQAIENAERLEREKQEAIERAELEAKQAAERAEQEKQQAIEQEKERQRQEQIRLEQEAKAREEDKKHRAKINNAALKCFVNGGLTEEQAKLAVTLIASKQVDNVSIYY